MIILAIKYESQCVSCGFPCRYEDCRNYRVKVLICDDCGEEFDVLYQFDGEELCGDCVLKRLGVVE